METASGSAPIEKANAYGYYHACGIWEGQRGCSEKRVVNLTRNGYLGSQKYGTILWSGDVAADWETLKNQIAAGLNFCASGLPYWTLDIGAFFVKKGSPGTGTVRLPAERRIPDTGSSIRDGCNTAPFFPFSEATARTAPGSPGISAGRGNLFMMPS